MHLPFLVKSIAISSLSIFLLSSKHFPFPILCDLLKYQRLPPGATCMCISDRCSGARGASEDPNPVGNCFCHSRQQALNQEWDFGRSIRTDAGISAALILCWSDAYSHTHVLRCSIASSNYCFSPDICPLWDSQSFHLLFQDDFGAPEAAGVLQRSHLQLSSTRSLILYT